MTRNIRQIFTISKTKEGFVELGPIGPQEVRPGSAGSPCGANCHHLETLQLPAATVAAANQMFTECPRRGKGQPKRLKSSSSDLHSKAVLRPHSLHGQKESPFLSSASRGGQFPEEPEPAWRRHAVPQERARRRPAPALKPVRPPDPHFCSLRARDTPSLPDSGPGQSAGRGNISRHSIPSVAKHLFCECQTLTWAGYVANVHRGLCNSALFSTRGRKRRREVSSSRPFSRAAGSALGPCGAPGP